MCWRLSLSAFTLTETDTYTETEINKMVQNPKRICVGDCFCAVWTPLHNHTGAIFIGRSVSVSLWFSVSGSVNTS